MKTIILLAMLSSAVCLSCTNKQQQFLPKATPDKELVIIGGNDTVTSVQVSSVDKNSIIYDTPDVAFGMSQR